MALEVLTGRIADQVPRESVRRLNGMLVTVLPTGTPETPGLRLILQRGPDQGGPTFPDIVNPPRWNPAQGADWSHHYRQYRERRRGPAHAERIPELQKPITLTGGGEAHIEKVLQELSERTYLPVIGEYDPCLGNPYWRELSWRVTLSPGAVKEQPAWKALDTVCRQFDLDWDFRNGWIQVRSPRTPLAWSGELDLSPPRRQEPSPASQPPARD